MDQQKVYSSTTSNKKGFLLDLIIYLSVMFLIREVSIPNASFLVTGIFWSITALIVASWRMKVRGVTWKDIGLIKPKNLKKTFLISVMILIATVISIIFFNFLMDQVPFLAELLSSTESSSDTSISKFGDLKGNWLLFLSIMPLVLLESSLEELLDRGFLINWFEKLFSSTSFATVIAVVLQAAIFGFRHSYDLSERSITVGIIGLIMGIAYIVGGRNLWALIIAHCFLNTLSMVERVV